MARTTRRMWIGAFRLRSFVPKRERKASFVRSASKGPSIEGRKDGGRKDESFRGGKEVREGAVVRCLFLERSSERVGREGGIQGRRFFRRSAVRKSASDPRATKRERNRQSDRRALEHDRRIPSRGTEGFVSCRPRIDPKGHVGGIHGCRVRWHDRFLVRGISSDLRRLVLHPNLVLQLLRSLILGRRAEVARWSVQWEWPTIIQLMFLWFVAFWAVGSWVVPLSAQALGYDRSLLTYRGQAFYSLMTDLAEMAVGLSIFGRYLRQYQPLGEGWFPFKIKGRWWAHVLVGCLSFPIVNYLSMVNQELIPLVGEAWTVVSPLEQSVTSQDMIGNILYVAVVSFCAPIWEEIIFRGFLLPSLTRYMSLGSSIVLSSIIFAIAHFSMQRMLPLFFLGLVMGIVFVRSRNLLASIVLHSLWNGFVFFQLLN